MGMPRSRGQRQRLGDLSVSLYTAARGSYPIFNPAFVIRWANRRRGAKRSLVRTFAADPDRVKLAPPPAALHREPAVVTQFKISSPFFTCAAMIGNLVSKASSPSGFAPIPCFSSLLIGKNFSTALENVKKEAVQATDPHFFRKLILCFKRGQVCETLLTRCPHHSF